jgi:hypothetical protein
MFQELGARQLLTLLFVGFSAFSGISMVFSARNYMEFFPATTGATVEVVSLNVQPDGQQINVVFTLKNPTGYSGITLRAFQASLTFKSSDGRVNRPYGDLPGVSKVQGPLDPHSGLEITSQIPILGQTWSGIAQNLTKGILTANFQVTVNLSTFLDSVAWLYIYYECNVSQTPTSCDRTETVTIPTGGGGGGGS